MAAEADFFGWTLEDRLRRDARAHHDAFLRYREWDPTVEGVPRSPGTVEPPGDWLEDRQLPTAGSYDAFGYWHACV